MDVVKVKKDVDYEAVAYLINAYSEVFESIDSRLSVMEKQINPGELKTVQDLREKVQKCATLYLATLEEVFDYVWKGRK